MIVIGVGAWFVFNSQLTKKQDAGLANPASVFCVNNGGRLDIRTNASGGQTGYCIFKDNSECEEWAYSRGECKQGEPVLPETEISIRLYYYNPALDQGPGGAQCTSKGLVAVERMIPKTTMPLTESIKLLLKGEISQAEKAQGLTSEFPLAGVTLALATVENGVATLTFSDSQNKTGGGSCRVAILWAQIEATAKQFPTVTSVRFLPEELFQP